MLKTKPIELSILSFLLLVLAACGGAGSASGATEQPGEVTSTEAEQETGVAFVPFANLATIELLTPASGAGVKPLFAWSPVAGAQSYSVYVQFSDGQPYWAWSGASTSIYMGGLASPPPEDAEGPILVEGMAWAVLAFDADSTVIASSVLQPISP